MIIKHLSLDKIEYYLLIVSDLVEEYFQIFFKILLFYVFLF